MCAPRMQAPHHTSHGLDFVELLPACLLRTKQGESGDSGVFPALLHTRAFSKLKKDVSRNHAKFLKLASWLKKDLPKEVKAWQVQQEKQHRSNLERSNRELLRLQNHIWNMIPPTYFGGRLLEFYHSFREDEAAVDDAIGENDGESVESFSSGNERRLDVSWSFLMASFVALSAVFACTGRASFWSNTILMISCVTFLLLLTLKCCCGRSSARTVPEQRRCAPGKSKDLLMQLASAALPDGGILRMNPEKPEVVETKHCTSRVCGLVRPAKDASMDDFEYKWHFDGRKRLWEFRVQIKFHTPPETLYFGIELENFAPMSAGTKMVYSMVKRIIFSYFGSGLYHSSGDNPDRCEDEVEPPTFALPLWGFDQIIVSPRGQEPKLMGNLEGLGISRSSYGLRKYKEAVAEIVNSIDTNHVYTFLFWGPSPYADIINWEIGGLPGGSRLDLTDLAGKIPFALTVYDLGARSAVDGGGPPKDGRHLRSRKRYYFQRALWHEAFCAPPAHLADASKRG